jgi:Putative zincin peptidase
MYLGEMSRNRFVGVLLAPFLIISVAPLVVCALWSIRSDLVMLVSLLNALFACVDLIGAWLLMTQLPSSAMARNKGWETWWREG